MLMYMNGSRIVCEDVEPNGNDLLDRQFENGSDGQLTRIDDEWWFEDRIGAEENRNSEWVYKNTENPIRYHSEWLMLPSRAGLRLTCRLSSFSSLLLIETTPRRKSIVSLITLKLQSMPLFVDISATGTPLP